MKRLMALAILTATPAHAADKALILNDQEQGAMHAICDAAVRAQGISPIGRNAIYLCDKLDASGVVTEHKDGPPVPAPESPK